MLTLVGLPTEGPCFKPYSFYHQEISVFFNTPQNIFIYSPYINFASAAIKLGVPGWPEENT